MPIYTIQVPQIIVIFSRGPWLTLAPLELPVLTNAQKYLPVRKKWKKGISMMEFERTCVHYNTGFVNNTSGLH